MATRRILVGVVALLLVPSVLGATPADTAIPAGAVGALQWPGFLALQTHLLSGGLYQRATNLDRAFVSDQMIGVQALLVAAAQNPDSSAAYRAQADELWRVTNAAWNPDQKFYALVTPPPSQSVCIDLPTNAWALLAATALVASSPNATPEPRQRLGDLQSTVAALLRDLHNECGFTHDTTALNHIAIPLWALLLSRSVAPNPSIDQTVQQTIQDLLQKSFQDGFVDPSGLRNPLDNAQMLCVLVLAAKAFPDAAIAQARDRTLDLLQDVLIQRDGSHATVIHVFTGENATEPSVQANPVTQLWTAYALYNAQLAQPARVDASLITALMDTYRERRWSTDKGAFVEDDGQPFFEPNALAALFMRGPVVRGSILDSGTTTLVVPARVGYQYARPASPDARFLASNLMVRFNLANAAAGAADIVLPAQMLAAVNLSLDPQGLYVAPTLSRTAANGAPLSTVALNVTPGPIDLLRFHSILTASPTWFRLDAYAPLRPVRADFGDTIQVAVENVGGKALTLRTLQLELDARNITVDSLSLNDEPVTGFQVIPSVAHELLPERHVRVLLNGAAFPADSESTLVLTYRDSEEPTVSLPVVALTRDGAEGPPPATPINLVQGQTAFVGATVHDNAALRNVLLRYQAGRGPEVLVVMTETTPGTYVAELPRSNAAGTATAQITAVDAQGNLGYSPAFSIKTENPLLAGSLVLFVFAAVLFVTTFFIWFKLGRKGRMR